MTPVIFAIKLFDNQSWNIIEALTALTHRLFEKLTI